MTTPASTPNSSDTEASIPLGAEIVIDLPARVADDRRRRRQLVNSTLGALKAKHAAERTFMQKFADWLMDIASSTPFFVAHALWFVVWIPWNLGAFGLHPFDPFPFGLLTMVVSLEAIFLSVFVLMAQKRESAIAELREEVTLQVNLRVEEEVTKSLQLLNGLYTRLGHRIAADEELLSMMQPLDITALEQDLAEQIGTAGKKKRRRRRSSGPGTSPPV